MDNTDLAAQHYKEIEVFHQFWKKGSSYSFALQERPSWGIFCILSGEAVYFGKEGRSVTAKSGDVVLLKKGGHYRVEFQAADTDDILVNFACSGSFVDASAEDVLLCKAPPSIADDFTQLWNASADTGRSCMVYSHFFRILDAITTEQPQNALAAEVMRLLHAEGGLFLHDGALAKACSVSVSTMQRAFCSAFGKTVCTYRNEIRIQRAKALLLSGNYSTEAVAEQLHYCDCAYFSRSFKRHTGLSPKQFVRRSAPA